MYQAMNQSIKKYGHKSHVSGSRRSKKIISDNLDRWTNELNYWFKKYKK